MLKSMDLCWLADSNQNLIIEPIEFSVTDCFTLMTSTPLINKLFLWNLGATGQLTVANDYWKGRRMFRFEGLAHVRNPNYFWRAGPILLDTEKYTFPSIKLKRLNKYLFVFEILKLWSFTNRGLWQLEFRWNKPKPQTSQSLTAQALLSYSVFLNIFQAVTNIREHLFRISKKNKNIFYRFSFISKNVYFSFPVKQALLRSIWSCIY